MLSPLIVASIAYYYSSKSFAEYLADHIRSVAHKHTVYSRSVCLKSHSHKVLPKYRLLFCLFEVMSVCSVTLRSLILDTD